MRESLWLAIAVASVSSVDQPQKQLDSSAATGQLSVGDQAVVGEAYHLWRSLGDKLWPGWTKTAMPMIYITRDHEFAIGFAKALKGFQALGDVRLENQPIQVRARVFAPQLEASFPVDGTAAVVIGSPANIKKSPNDWVITAIHEMFHVLQFNRGSSRWVASLKIGPELDASWQLNFPFPYKNADVMRLIHLQGYLAYLGAEAADAADCRYKAGASLEATEVYRNILGRLDPGGKSANYSRFQEWNEGGAFYTEYQMARAAADGDYTPTAAFTKLPGAKSYRRLWDDTYKSKIFLAKHAGRAAQSRTAFYHLGMAKCLLLDRLDPKWKESYFSDEGWLDNLLRTAVGRRPGS